MKNILETLNLTKAYKKINVVDNVSMHIPKGEIYGFVGRNGAGKTTTMRLICGMASPTNGEIIFNGNKSVAFDKMGTLIESPGLYLNMTAYDNLKCKAVCYGEFNKSQILDLLNIVGLQNDSKILVKDYSLGMKQRLGIALSLIGDPEILILDEPINGLDPQGIAEIRKTLLKLSRERGITILISSHILSELYKIATIYGFINKGKLVLEITKEELDERCKGCPKIKVSDIIIAENILKKKKKFLYDIQDDLIVLKNDENLSEILNLLATNNVNIENIENNETNLEDFYFNICNKY